MCFNPQPLARFMNCTVSQTGVVRYSKSSENSYQDANISEHLSLFQVEWHSGSSGAHRDLSHAEDTHHPVSEASTHRFGFLYHLPSLPSPPHKIKAQLYILPPRVEARDREWWHSMGSWYCGPGISTASACNSRKTQERLSGGLHF